jgi:hypothetical protein
MGRGALRAGGVSLSDGDDSPSTFPRLPMTVWLGFALGILASGVCLIAVGINLGFYFGGIIAAALLIPALSLAERSLVHRLFIAGAVTDGIAVVWLVGLFGSISILQWLLCYALLICWAFALASVAHLLDQVIRHSILASAIVVVMALLWLSWPVWLWQVDWPILVKVHPLFAINGMLSNLGVWPERPIAYQHLMRLGQDIPYALPRNIAPAVAIHLLVGSTALLLGRVVGRS